MRSSLASAGTVIADFQCCSYGPQGFQILKEVLEEEFVQHNMISSSRIRPLNIDSYLRRVLVPEAATLLIQEDQQCDYDTAVRILKDSRAYGAAVFAQVNTEDVAESQEERNEREKDRASQNQRRKALLNEGGRQAKALKVADTAIEQLSLYFPA